MSKLWQIIKYWVILEAWKLDKVQRWLSQHRLFGRFYRMKLDESPAHNEAVMLPVNEAVRGTESVVLPYQILKPLVEQAAGLFILGRCPCRNAEGCRAAPHDFGCLYLGEAVGGLSAEIGRGTDAAGALAHIEEALGLGLVPMVVHASFDAAMLSLPYQRMLAVCFCCECCCTVRHRLRLGPSTFDETVLRMPGLTVKIGEGCTGCGECHTHCPVGAISFDEAERSVIDQEVCKGCGACAAACPNEAVALEMAEGLDAVEALFERIRARTEIGI